MSILSVFGLAISLVDVSERACYVGQPWGGSLSFTVEGVLFYFVLVRDQFVPEETLAVKVLAHSFSQLSGFLGILLFEKPGDCLPFFAIEET